MIANGSSKKNTSKSILSRLIVFFLNFFFTSYNFFICLLYCLLKRNFKFILPVSSSSGLSQLFLAMQIQWQLILQPRSRISTPSRFFAVSIVRNSGWEMVSRRRAAWRPSIFHRRDEAHSPPWPERTRAPSLWEKQCNCFRLMWTAAACPLEYAAVGLVPGDLRDYAVCVGGLSSLHFAPLLIHSRSIIPKAETPRVYLRDALIYPAPVSPSPLPAFVSHFHLSLDRSVWRAGVVAALIISVISTASTRGIREVGAAGRRGGGPPTIAE